jgi:hypothetical protein
MNIKVSRLLKIMNVEVMLPIIVYLVPDITSTLKFKLLIDDGGGMNPDKMRLCMSLGYSAKSKVKNTIGQCKFGGTNEI